LRAVRRAPFLRGQRAFSAVRAALAVASRSDFRVIHFSVQPDHVHLIVEAHDKLALSRGMRGLAIRIARGLNAALDRRGSLWGDRWHGRDLRTPREVRNCLVYVLANFKKHVRGARGVDFCSSAPWFDGWRERVTAPTHDPPTRAPRTWLAAAGWRRHGLLSLRESPASLA
jgi:REP element-mobilizing transposase RayT